MKNIKEFSSEYFSKLGEDIKQLDVAKIEKIIEVLLEARDSGRQIFILGNGGSASTSSHFACDLLKGTVCDFNDPGEKRAKVISLTDNVALMTAIGNDLRYEEIFWQQLRNLAKKGDVAVVFSASGNSPNVVMAVQKAKELGVKTIGFLGFKTGGKLHGLVDYEITIQDGHYGRVEDLHMVLSHLVADYLKNYKFN